ncbi:MAG: imidazolonepropionase [Chitinophagaceae bacterium]|nr:imidazolonepropionase [Chitinophagaceae bacterium]
MRIFIPNIKSLLQTENNENSRLLARGQDMKMLPSIDNAWLLIEDGLIKAYGDMPSLDTSFNVDQTIDAKGGLVLPAWCDSHTHLVFAHSREHEFIDRINGLSYEAIAQRGGGILNSAKKLNAASEDELVDLAMQRLDEVKALGTGAIEIKSGYGLCTEGELKMLRVIRRLKEHSTLTIKATFLAGHAYPLEYRDNHEGFIKLIIHDMLPKVADENLAEYIDVFCEKGFFSVDETDRILEAGVKYGLKPKVHANQLYNSGGIQIGVKHHAISVDHLETMDQEEIECLRHSNTIPTLLPGAAFFLAMHYQPARKIIDAGLPVALASDYNPGSCPSGNMNLILSLACSQMRMTPEEAINACTINGAAAMEVNDILGSIKVGKKANLIITKPIPSVAYLPYAFGTNLIEKVMIS